MEFKSSSSPFGSQTRTRVMVLLSLLGSSYPLELSRLVGSGNSVVRKALASLARDGLVAGRLTGRTRVFTLTPTYFAAKELRSYLQRLADADRELRQRAAQLRRRPRWIGKPL
jgi:predicted transcriptional regulator